MPRVRQSDEVVALAVADIHLSHRRPSARADENWYAVMSDYFRYLGNLQKRYDVPIICAGDLVHHWNVPAELINAAILMLPAEVYAVPGQHDLPWHGYEQRGRSAYATLVAAGAIVNVDPGPRPLIYQLPNRDRWLALYGFPWGYMPAGRTSIGADDQYLHIALLHHYVYQEGAGHVGADPTGNVAGWSRALAGYDVVICGDNHAGFTARVGETTVYNCGCYIPRRADERDCRPSIGLVMADGRVERHYVKGIENVWHDTPEPRPTGERGAADFSEFVGALSDLDVAATDFCETLRRAAESSDVAPDLRRMLRETLDACRES